MHRSNSNPSKGTASSNRLINCAELAQLIHGQSALVIIDCRPSNDFNTFRVKDSVGVISLPTVIERRVLRGSVSAYMYLTAGTTRDKLLLKNRAAELSPPGANSSRTDPDPVVVLIAERRGEKARKRNSISRSSDQINVVKTAEGLATAGGTSKYGGNNTDGDDFVSLLLLKQLCKDGFKSYILSSPFKSFCSRYPQLCTGKSTEPSNNSSNESVKTDTVICTRPQDLGPLVQLESLKLAPSSPEGSDSCYSSPELSAETEHHQTLQIMKPRGHRSLACSAPVLPSLFDAPPLDDTFPYHEYTKERSCRANCVEPVQILPYLYLGNAQNSADRSILDKLDIRYILNVTPNLKNWFEEDGEADFKYLQIPIDDHWSQNLAEYFPKAIAFIEEARLQRCGVLVHCVAGISRSVTVTVAYLMQQLGKSMEDAYDIVKQQKPNIAPNFNFMGQLLEFQNELQALKSLQDPGFESGSGSSSGSSAKSFHFLDHSPLVEEQNKEFTKRTTTVTQAQKS